VVEEQKMLFTSVRYAVFLPIVFAFYWLVPKKLQWMILFVASLIFYGYSGIPYLLLMIFTTFVSYICALAIDKAPKHKNNKKYKKIFLLICAASSLGTLFFFKYFDLLSNTVTAFLNLFGLHLNPILFAFVLPIGISFFTFQTLAYTIDVYRGNVKAEKNFAKYATFIIFFPQLVAGPIERTKNLLPQILQEHVFDYNKATYGLKRMAWGFFKKMVLADTLAIYVDSIFDSVNDYTGFSLVLAALFFAVQIYCDFSGYSDIAIGTAKLFGIDLMVNFNSPFFSASIKEFWSRWHISLSTWFRDYVYIPLGGNRVGKVRHAFNIIATFTLSGLWHGANLTFIIWGLLHGVAQVIENLFNIKKTGKHTFKWFVSVVFVFAFVVFAFIFFRSPNIKDAIYVITHLFSGAASPISYFATGFRALHGSAGSWVTLIFSLLLLTGYDFCSLKNNVLLTIEKRKPAFRWVLYICFIVLMFFLIPSASHQGFIYFRF
jgi:D-alanyl-lipoteichoic acid acyltransferase DltB (MBOAT superfamily)